MEKIETERSIEWLVEEIMRGSVEANRNREEQELIRRGEFRERTERLVRNLISEELDKAREEGRLSVIQELLFEPEEPSHNIGTLEAAFKYGDIIKRYSGEWRNKTGLVSPKGIKSKLKDNK